MGCKIIDDVKPEPGEIVVDKNRFSGFPHTNLDAVLKTCKKKHLIFLGVATNICVESTARDAHLLDYWPIIVSDGVGHIGPPFTQDATLFAFEAVLGWVTTVDDVVKAFK